MGKIKIFIVDDHEMFREGVKMLLSKSQEFEIIGEAQNGKDCIENLPGNTDIVLMDISMPEMNGIEATQKLEAHSPELKIIALSMFGDEEYYYKMIHAGVNGFILKEAGSKEMEDAIRIVYKGGNFFSPELLRNVVVGFNDQKQYSRDMKSSEISFEKEEVEVLKKLCTGCADHEIASDMQISTEAVETHKAGLLNKTGTKDTIGLVMHALKFKLVSFS